jgi:hypothetical protein
MKGKCVILLSLVLVTISCSNSNSGRHQSKVESSGHALAAEASGTITPNVAENEAELAVRATLKDPESARFTDLRSFNLGGSLVVCGYVNAKNSFGGYVGKKPFYIDKGENYYQDKSLDGRPHIIQDENSFDITEWRNLCRSDSPKRS